jgi:hypothetical protein
LELLRHDGSIGVLPDVDRASNRPSLLNAVLLSGGRGKVTEHWARTEARVFADVAAQHGVPREAMILEETASNTGENITRTRALLDQAAITVHSGPWCASPTWPGALGYR